MGVHMEVHFGERRRGEDVSCKHVRMFPSWHATGNVYMPRPDRTLQEIAYAPAPTAAPDRSGIRGTVAYPAPRGPVSLKRTRRTCDLRTDDPLPLARRVR